MTSNDSAAAYLETLKLARAASAGSDWTKAVSLWETVVAANPVNGSGWQALAEAREGAGDDRGAIVAWQQVFRLGEPLPSETAVRIVRCRARLGEIGPALMMMDQALALGYHDLDGLRNHPDLAPLRDDYGFQEMIGIVGDRPSRNRCWLFDLDFAANEIHRRAYGMDQRLSLSALNNLFMRIKERLSSLSDAQIMLELLRVLRNLNDGHARVRPPEHRLDLQRMLPMQIFSFPEGVAITAIHPAHATLAGARILRIGGHEIGNVIAAFEPVTPRDNENEMWALRGLEDWIPYTTALQALGIIPDADRAELTVETTAGSRLTVTIKADPEWTYLHHIQQRTPPASWVSFPETPATPTPACFRQRERHFWFEHLPDHETIYAQFNVVRDTETETITAFGERLLAAFDETGSERLVLDMRWNGGGNTFQAWPFLRLLAAHTRVNRHGALMVITGRRTFSAAQNGVNFLAQHTEAMFVGEPTGSSPQFIGETRYFSLPYSGFVMNVSDLHWVGTWPGDHRPWIPPDIYAPPSLEMYRAGRDPALEAALSVPLPTT